MYNNPLIPTPIVDDEEVDVAAEDDEEEGPPNDELTMTGFWLVDVDNDTSGLSAKRSVTCHISPTAAG
jgi:hypothetical protein